MSEDSHHCWPLSPTATVPPNTTSVRDVFVNIPVSNGLCRGQVQSSMLACQHEWDCTVSLSKTQTGNSRRGRLQCLHCVQHVRLLSRLIPGLLHSFSTVTEKLKNLGMRLQGQFYISVFATSSASNMTWYHGDGMLRRTSNSTSMACITCCNTNPWFQVKKWLLRYAILAHSHP